MQRNGGGCGYLLFFKISFTLPCSSINAEKNSFFKGLCALKETQLHFFFAEKYLENILSFLLVVRRVLIVRNITIGLCKDLPTYMADRLIIELRICSNCQFYLPFSYLFILQIFLLSFYVKSFYVKFCYTLQNLVYFYFCFKWIHLKWN